MSTHQRDGSLLRKKQDQWARERAEESENIWFPFGSPGGGTPNRKFEAINYTSPLTRADAQDSQPEDRSADHREPRTHRESTSPKLKSQQNHVKMAKEAERCPQNEHSHTNPFVPQQLPMAYPFPVHCTYPVPPGGFPTNSGPNGMQWSYLQPIPVNFVPPGTVPIPIQDLSRSIAEGKPICPVTVAEQLAQMTPQNACWGPHGPAVPVAYPIQRHAMTHNAPVDPDQEPHTSNVAVVPPLESDHQGQENGPFMRGTISRRSTVDSDRRSSITDYDEQIAEKKRLEAEEAERERYEEERIRREKELKERREAEQKRRHEEEERIREQERERVRQTLEEALERAKREAEVTRKARVFKHVLEGADKSPELERRLLGVDPETGDRILQEITQLERHKKLDQENLGKAARSSRADQREPSPSLVRSKSVQPKSRSQSMSESIINDDLRGSREATPSGKKQTASIRPFMSADDRDLNSDFATKNMYQPSSTYSTPLRRSATGRMSVRVTKKEKENSPVEDPGRPPGRIVNTGIQSIHTSQFRDQGMPPSKIPVATPVSSASKSSCRPRALPPQPLRNANHLPEFETGTFQGIPRPNYLPPTSKDFADNPLFSPVATRHRRPNRMRGLSNSPINVDSAESSGSTEESNEAISSSGSASPQESASSPVPNLAVALTNSVPTTPKHVYSHISVDHKIRSTLSTPASYLGPSPRSSSYAMKLVEKGCGNHSEDVLSPEIRRKVEANLSRTSSIQSLRASIGNLAGWRGSVSNLAEDQLKPNLTRFKSMNPAYRSFNTKRTTEKQQEVIDRLSRLRESLRSRENFVERGVLPKRNNNSSPATTSAAIKT